MPFDSTTAHAVIDMVKGRPFASAQDMLDRGAWHLFRQGKQSKREQVLRRRREMVSHAFCAYRGMDGLQCVIGIGIPDAEYEDAMEGNGIRAMAAIDRFRHTPCIVALMPFIETAEMLQRVHDSMHTHGSMPAEWQSELRYALLEVAGVHGLNRVQVELAWLDARRRDGDG